MDVTFLVGMEADEQNVSVELVSEKSIVESVPHEIIYHVLKELIKIYISDFMLSEENVNPEEIVTVKNVRLVNKFFKAHIDFNRLLLLRVALKELFSFESSNLNDEVINNQLSKILIDECNLENERKAALLILAGVRSDAKIKWMPDKENKLIDEDFILIMIARSGQFKKLINLLKRYGFNINIIDLSHGSPLIAATQNDQPEIVEILIKNGADINIQHKGLTALDIAKEKDNEQIEYLIAPCWWITKIFRRLMNAANDQILNHHAGF